MSASRTSATRKPSHSRPAGRLDARAEFLMLAGVVITTVGVAVSMLPGGYSVFGPVKALVLLGGCGVIALGLALKPSLATAAAGRVGRERGAWPALALLGIATLATVTSIDPSQSFVGHYPEYQGLLLLLTSAFAAFGAYSLADKDSTWRALGRAATIALLLVSVYAAVQYVGADPVAYQREFVVRRVRSTLGNASNLGVFLALALPFAVARARAERGVWCWIAWAATVAGVVTLAWSLSRGAWVGALVGVAAWLVVEGRRWSARRRLRAAAVALGVAVAAVALAALLVPNASSRIAGLLDPSTGTPGWRIEVFSAAARMIAERPILGFGPASFRYAFPPRRTAAMMAGETGAQVLEDPHNLLASTGIAAGVLAIAALIWLLGAAMLAAWRIERDDGWPLAGPALAAAIAGGATALQFHFATLDSAPLLAVAIGLALGHDGARTAAASARATAGAPSGARATSVARWVAAALAALFGVGAVLAGGLVLADRQIARGYALVGQGAPWTDARAAFASAEELAPWEPTAQWALGRGATQALSTPTGADAFPDGEAAMQRVLARLPLDSLAVAQTADVYLVAGLAAHDRAKLDAALAVADRAIAADPQNGYRWEARGAALAGLGDTDGARAAFERAVEYAPNDQQAWLNLARIYERMGRADLATTARARADASASNALGQ